MRILRYICQGEEGEDNPADWARDVVLGQLNEICDLRKEGTHSRRCARMSNEIRRDGVQDEKGRNKTSSLCTFLLRVICPPIADLGSNVLLQSTHIQN